MPWKITKKWVPPNLFFEHKGINIYHVYKNQDIDEGPMIFWYSLSNTKSDDSGKGGYVDCWFDARRLPTWKNSPETTLTKIYNPEYDPKIAIKAAERALKEAIERGILIQNKNPIF